MLAIWEMLVSAQDGKAKGRTSADNTNAASWFDHSRDLLALVNHFRDEMPYPLIGLGHSMGGAQM